MPDILLIEADGATTRDLYIREILSHAGLFYSTLAEYTENDPLPPFVLIIGKRLSHTWARRIAHHVQQGGLLLSLGATVGLEETLGVVSARDADEGWIEPRQTDHPCVKGLDAPLHVYGGVTTTVKTATEVASLKGKAAVTWHRFGEGFAAFIGADIVGAVVHIQQGISVVTDGAPAPDGTAPLDDGILKAEDGHVLDWERDRQTVSVPRGRFPCVWGGNAKPPDPLPPEDEPYPFRAFLEPVADNLRALLLKMVFALADAGNVPLTVLWYWAKGMDAVAHLSHDSDGNDPVLAEELRRVCVECEIPGTWCMLYPGGYAPNFYRRLRNEGFEVALHFDALEKTGVRGWDRQHLAIQARWLRDMTGVESIRSNKNHYTRWEGR
ncbi:MAG: hypothetical protein O3A46_17735, partial [Candidatus Poribacteria bacterium]|nr:hypothetical protein [Candidatus Poribacteria bacterium]